MLHTKVAKFGQPLNPRIKGEADSDPIALGFK